MKSKTTKQVWIGSVAVGGGAPISIQSMTNTRTEDVQATAAQIGRLHEAGCDIVRIAVPDMAAAGSIAEIKRLQPQIPLVGDIHFDYRLALTAVEQGIDALRLNPGNIGEEANIIAVVRAAKQRRIPIRIGVNAGSLEKELLMRYGHPTPEAMVESALRHVRLLERHDFYDIKLSLKANDVPMTIKAYQLMSEMVDYPLHLGITEAGTVSSGVIKSSVGIGSLLVQNIGDTVRVSLTGDPVEEVKVAGEILKALNLRQYGPTLISCPTCGRTQIDLVGIATAVEKKLASIKKPIKVAVMGCVVNGPGEAKEADVGVAGGREFGIIFRKGEILKKVSEDKLLEELFKEIDRIEEDA